MKGAGKGGKSSKGGKKGDGKGGNSKGKGKGKEGKKGGKLLRVEESADWSEAGQWENDAG